MDIREIVMEAGMSARPGYYAGRNPDYLDLDSRTLNQIADLIKKHYGTVAHDNYVKMVWDMKALSASAFLTNLYQLINANWDLQKVNLTDSDENIEKHEEVWGMIAAVSTKSVPRKTDFTSSNDFIRRGFRKVT